MCVCVHVCMYSFIFINKESIQKHIESNNMRRGLRPTVAKIQADRDDDTAIEPVFRISKHHIFSHLFFLLLFPQPPNRFCLRKSPSRPEHGYHTLFLRQ